MKRYYLDRLSLFESFLKALIINILITIIIIVLFVVLNLEFYFWYIYGLVIMNLITFIVHSVKSFEKISFFIEDNSIYYCKGNKEIKIDLDNIDLVEEYFGINYLFRVKTIILHVKNKKYNFVFKKDRANKFKKNIVELINNEANFKDIFID